jgi:2-keto-4-pentenoate hydratase/2-oxohepta-3-ene-1,7-dioic acid hydratase in catechol pathway
VERRRIIRYRKDGDEGRAELLEGDRLRVLAGPMAARLDEVSLLAPAMPSKIIGVGLNYRAHAAEMGKKLPDEPLLFLKPSTALLDPGEPIVRPSGFSRVDYEGELGVVIGRAARRVPAKDALSFVAGYCCVNDVTVRDLQQKDVQYTRAKGFDTFAPVGPCLASGLDPRDLGIITRVDGHVRQKSSTSDMIFDVTQIIETASRVMTLLPGDVIATGTPPGVGPIEPGMVVEVEIEGIGILRNPVISEDQPPPQPRRTTEVL